MMNLLQKNKKNKCLIRLIKENGLNFSREEFNIMDMNLNMELIMLILLKKLVNYLTFVMSLYLKFKKY